MSLKKDLFIIERCKTKAAWTAKPTRPFRLNLEKIQKKHKTVLTTPILLVLENVDNCGDIIVHRYGELVFKSCTDVNKMKTITTQLYAEGA